MVAALAHEPVLAAIAPYSAAGGEVLVDQILHLGLHFGLPLERVAHGIPPTWQANLTPAESKCLTRRVLKNSGRPRHSYSACRTEWGPSDDPNSDEAIGRRALQRAYHRHCGFSAPE